MDLTPKQFINQVLIEKIGEIKDKYPYISFAIMAIGIEFLGKCLNGFGDWNKSGRSKKDFELAINELESFDKYRSLLESHKLWDSLRNGFAHSFVPKKTLSLSSKDELGHLENPSATKINLKCEDFYNDFSNACQEIIDMTFSETDKMSRPLLSIPESSQWNSDELNDSYSGKTSL